MMEYADQGDLSQKIKKYQKEGKRFPESIIVKYFFQLTSAIKELHQRSIIHRDLKTANIFLLGNEIKLGDMNVSKIVKNFFAET